MATEHNDYCPRNPARIWAFDYPNSVKCACHLTMQEYHDQLSSFVDDLIAEREVVR